jgi:hypothetical protein
MGRRDEELRVLSHQVACIVITFLLLLPLFPTLSILAVASREGPY